jgi:CHAD domain-containing protein
LKTPNAKQIHDIRTSIRRLDTAFQILPKRNKSGSSFSEYVLKCKDLFDVNSEIRDLDIICEKLQKYPPSDQRNGLIEILKTTRNANLENAKAIARSIKKIHMDKIIDKIGITEKELQKRYCKTILRSVSMIESTFPVVIISDQNLKELHDLRISCKKLKYLLELQEDERKRILKTKKHFKNFKTYLEQFMTMILRLNILYL